MTTSTPPSSAAPPASGPLRWLRHLLSDEQSAARTIGEHGLTAIETAIGDSERLHSGEIRVCVEGGLPTSYLLRGLSARDRAIAMFGKLGVWDTEANNGVLIYVLLADHAIEIVADRGVNARVPDSQWQAIVSSMADTFRAGAFEQGILAAIAAVHELLLAHYRLAPGGRDSNELPDRPAVY